MEKRETAHPLRTIVLHYNEAIPEKEYEKKFLEEYVKLHGATFTIIQRLNKLRYEFMEHEDAIKDAVKLLVPITEQINAFYKEAIVLTKNKANRQNINEMIDRMDDFYNASLVNYSSEVIDKLGKESDVLEKEYQVFEDADAELETTLETFDKDIEIELCNNYDQYTLDLTHYDEDKQNFLGEFEKIREFRFFRDVVIDKYNELMAELTTTYKAWDETKFLISGFYDDTGMMESSVSEYYAKNTKLFDENRPKYFLAPDDEKIEVFRKSMGLLANSQTKTIKLRFEMDDVRNGYVVPAQDIVLQLQHFPKLLEKFIFALEIEFLNLDGIPLKEDEWKGVDIPMRWFTKLCEFPVMIFFIHDPDCRGYCLFGDLIADKKVTIDLENGKVGIEGEPLQEICNRLFHYCYMFMMFCHKTGFDPEPYIEALLADFNLPFDFVQIKEKYEEDIKKGIHFRAEPDTKEEE